MTESPTSSFMVSIKDFSSSAHFMYLVFQTKHPRNDAGLAEHVYSQGVAHTHSLDNPITFCAIPSRRATGSTIVGFRRKLSGWAWTRTDSVQSSDYILRITVVQPGVPRKL